MMAHFLRGPAARLPSLQLDAQGYAGTAVRMGLPFAILASGLTALMDQASFAEVLLPRGLIMGLFFGLMMAFFYRGKIATVEVVGDKKSFVSRVNISLWRLGYQPATQTEDFFTYRPTLELGMSSGRIGVQFEDHRAVIFGPKMLVEKLAKVVAEAS